ncbi:PASTA domain-containing protein [Frankia sp. AgB1.9]|uniref:PASTA domain-containing protein n=1 Tax=unclassified Frankia TaxID=2632575 RepID=UPI001933DF4D|nr:MULTISPECIES: PASTA domain-containing protein [unclassified Frankia]MBL7493631.1 PASTA domain-containing protein [Frankia sp. AgW1.1]MBL7550525.1 PASTA domain-containing protein [Frankia sp. AgB1.9]MBL7624959.1 PASTA domain-containing protein [Frankia sp. AgB1.8]
MNPTRHPTDRRDDDAEGATADWLRTAAGQVHATAPDRLLTRALAAAPAARRRRRLAVAIPVTVTAFAVAAVITVTVLLTGSSPAVSHVTQPLAGRPAATLATTGPPDIPAIVVTIGTQPPTVAPTQPGPQTTVPAAATPPPSQALTTVPNTVGTTSTDATFTLRALGFTVSQTPVCRSTDIPAGQVLAQQPAAGTRAAPTATITLRVAADCVDVPNVVGTTPPAAKTTLEAAGLTVWLNGQWNCPAGYGSVTTQSPAGGTRAAQGSTVAITYACATSASVAPSP